MKILTPILLALSVLAAGETAAAEFKFAVVDQMEAIANSTQFKKARDDLEKDMAGEKAKLMKLQSDIGVCKQKMTSDLATMTQTEQAKLRTDCESKAADLQMLGQKYNRVASEREQAVLRDIAPKLQRAIDAVAKEGGYDVVFLREGLAFHKPMYEVTDKVTVKLNSQP
ncbi:MAG: OmpH family outer membrane protein [Pseudomonadota bacterium]